MLAPSSLPGCTEVLASDPIKESNVTSHVTRVPFSILLHREVFAAQAATTPSSQL